MKAMRLASVALAFATSAQANCSFPRRDEHAICALREAQDNQAEQLKAIAEETRRLRQQQQWDAPLLNGGR